jgi:hypothetical protein
MISPIRVWYTLIVFILGRLNTQVIRSSKEYTKFQRRELYAMKIDHEYAC